ncbi:MAG TPA: cadherin domain-containing protein [Pyrinomonadaceae bacterium]|nr:cadherin domain-containing protein [Pyrinomonadaceae bacterium]
MNHFTPTPSSRNARAFLASLLSYLLLFGQFAPAALAANGSAMRAAPTGTARGAGGESQGLRAAPAPAAARRAGPVITATKADSFVDGPENDGKADPGQDINYEVTVSNTGDAAATNVEFTDSIDSNAALDTGSVTMSPLARDDSYTSPAGGPLVVAAAQGVLGNDSGIPAPTAVPATGQATTKGGTVDIAADGSFTYTPADPTTFTGTDTFTYTATNGNSPDDTATVTISFDPAAADDTKTVNEDAAATTIDVLANDPDPDGGSKSIDSVTQPDNGSVVITNSGADLTYEPDDNYCNNPPGTTLDTFTYTLTPGGDTATVTVTVTCLNDAPTDIALSNDTVAENSATGTAVGTFSSTDPEAGDTHTYTLVAGTGDTDNASFQIVGDQLQTNAVLDFETDSSYSIRVRSDDSNGGTFEEVFTITATNVNEAPTDIALSNATVGENMPSGTAVGNLSATDPDAGDTHSFALVAGTGDADNASFQIVGNQLQTNASFDFETDSSYSVRVRVTDANSLTFEEAFTITITNQNEAPTDIALSNDTVAENSATGTLVGNLSTTDPDAGDSFTYTLVSGTGDGDNASFQISGSQLQTNASFDFETDSSYSVRVRSTDTGGAFFEEAFTITITDVNEGPTLTAGGVTPTFTEDGAAVAIDPGLTVTDVDSTDIQSATVQITGNYQNGQDLLAFVNTPNITGAFNAATGTLTLTGTDTLANYQAALRSVTYSNNSQNPVTTTRAVSFKAKDSGGADSNTAVTNVTVVAVNDAPVVVAGGTLAYTENDASTNIDGAITVTDVDDTNIESATAQITSNYVNGQDVLSFVNTPNITGNFDSSTGTLTLTGSDTLANYQTALRNVKYHNNSDDPTTAARTVSWQVNDGGPTNATSALVTSTINVTAVNDPPTANGFTNLPAQAGIPITYPVGKLGGTDVEAGTTVTINTTPDTLCTGCLLTINANGSFTFTPPPSAAGTTVGFTYHVSDNGNPAPGVDSAPATVSFTVAGPAIYFVKTAAVGAGNCTLGNECTLTTAVTNIGSATNTRIFIGDAGTYTSGVTLNDGGWLIGQGVNVAFDTLFGIGAPAQGTLAPRPSTNLSRPTLNDATATVTAHNNSAVRGLNIDVDAGSGAGVVAVNRTGTLIFSEMNVTSAAGNAIDLSNTSANFLGPHVINTTSGTGFEATGGGTVTVTGSTNTINSTAGTGLNISNTTIGAANVTFRSITVGTGAGSAGAGIRLDTTGSSGGLRVTGLDGGDADGNPDAGSGGTIQHKTGADGSTTSGVGIYLNNTRDVQLAGMQLNHFDNFAVRGSSVTNFTMTDTVINGTNGNNDSFDEGSVRFTQLAGSASITRGTISGGHEDNLSVVNTSGTLDRLTVDDIDFGANSLNFGSDGILVEAAGTAVLNVTIQNSAFTSTRGDHVQYNVAGGTPDGDFQLLNNTFSNNHAGVVSGGGGIRLVSGGTSSGSSITYNISGNNIQGARGAAVGVTKGAGTGNFSGTLNGNIIGTAGTANSGSLEGTGINIVMAEQGQLNANITNNQIRQYNNAGIFLQTGGTAVIGSGGLRAVVTGNTIKNPGNNTPAQPPAGLNGVHLNAGTLPGDTYQVCLTLGGAGALENDMVGAGDNVVATGTDFRLRQRQSTTVYLSGYAGANNDNAAVISYVQSQNTGTPTGNVSNVVPSGGGYSSASCPLPAPMSLALNVEEGSAAKADGWQADTPVNTGETTNAAPTTTAAPAAESPAPAQPRTWSDMPVLVVRTPRVNTEPGESPDFVIVPEKSHSTPEGEEGQESDSEEGEETDPAATEEKPAGRKPRVTRTETYRPQESKPAEQQPAPDGDVQDEPQAPAKTTRPGLRNISYIGPLGSAPSRAPRFTRASYTPAAERAPRTARTAPAAFKPAPKAVEAPKAERVANAVKAAPAAAALAPAAAAACSPSATLVCVQIGTMPAGKSVKIRFTVEVDNPFTGALEQIENQGSVSYSESGSAVLTDDPSEPGAADKTITPVAAPPDIVVHSASVPEPKTGSTNMVFTVTLSRNPPSNVSVDFTTVEEPDGSGKADSPADYTTTSGTLTFLPVGPGQPVAQRVLSISVPVLSDGTAEQPETFKVQLSNASGGNITVSEATGTIEPTATPGTVLISEVRTSGPGGAGDDFVEIYFNKDTDTVVPAGGWGLFKMGSDCDETPVLIGTLPAGTYEGRSHYLFVGSQYSLEDYGGTNAAQKDDDLDFDIEDDRNLGLFSTTDVAQLSTGTRLDAVGFGTNNQDNCNLLREGSNLGAAGGSATEHSFFRKLCGFLPVTRCQTDGTALDTQNNANDFAFANTDGSAVPGAGELLGAPGPENSDSPRQTNSVVTYLLDQSASAPSPPNRVRDPDEIISGVADAGTMSFRRRFRNSTGGDVTRLRFRVSEITTHPRGAGQAELRAISTGSDIPNVMITNDSETCGGPSSCTVTVKATTLEQPPNQPDGGGLNSTLTVTLGSPLANGADILVNFKVGVNHTGAYRFFVVIEALP